MTTGEPATHHTESFVSIKIYPTSISLNMGKMETHWRGASACVTKRTTTRRAIHAPAITSSSGKTMSTTSTTMTTIMLADAVLPSHEHENLECERTHKKIIIHYIPVRVFVNSRSSSYSSVYTPYSYHHAAAANAAVGPAATKPAHVMRCHYATQIEARKLLQSHRTVCTENEEWLRCIVEWRCKIMILIRYLSEKKWMCVMGSRITFHKYHRRIQWKRFECVRENRTCYIIESSLVRNWVL